MTQRSLATLSSSSLRAFIFLAICVSIQLLCVNTFIALAQGTNAPPLPKFVVDMRVPTDSENSRWSAAYPAIPASFIPRPLTYLAITNTATAPMQKNVESVVKFNFDHRMWPSGTDEQSYPEMGFTVPNARKSLEAQVLAATSSSTGMVPNTWSPTLPCQFYTDHSSFTPQTFASPFYRDGMYDFAINNATFFGQAFKEDRIWANGGGSGNVSGTDPNDQKDQSALTYTTRSDFTSSIVCQLLTPLQMKVSYEWYARSPADQKWTDLETMFKPSPNLSNIRRQFHGFSLNPHSGKSTPPVIIGPWEQKLSSTTNTVGGFFTFTINQFGQNSLNEIGFILASTVIVDKMTVKSFTAAPGLAPSPSPTISFEHTRYPDTPPSPSDPRGATWWFEGNVRKNAPEIPAGTPLQQLHPTIIKFANAPAASITSITIQIDYTHDLFTSRETIDSYDPIWMAMVQRKHLELTTETRIPLHLNAFTPLFPLPSMISPITIAPVSLQTDYENPTGSKLRMFPSAMSFNPTFQGSPFAPTASSFPHRSMARTMFTSPMKVASAGSPAATKQWMPFEWKTTTNPSKQGLTFSTLISPLVHNLPGEEAADLFSWQFTSGTSVRPSVGSGPNPVELTKSQMLTQMSVLYPQVALAPRFFGARSVPGFATPQVVYDGMIRIPGYVPPDTILYLETSNSISINIDQVQAQKPATVSTTLNLIKGQYQRRSSQGEAQEWDDKARINVVTDPAAFKVEYDRPCTKSNTNGNGSGSGSGNENGETCTRYSIPISLVSLVTSAPPVTEIRVTNTLDAALYFTLYRATNGQLFENASTTPVSATTPIDTNIKFTSGPLIASVKVWTETPLAASRYEGDTAGLYHYVTQMPTAAKRVQLATLPIPPSSPLLFTTTTPGVFAKLNNTVNNIMLGLTPPPASQIADEDSLTNNKIPSFSLRSLPPSYTRTNDNRVIFHNVVTFDSKYGTKLQWQSTTTAGWTAPISSHLDPNVIGLILRDTDTTLELTCSDRKSTEIPIAALRNTVRPSILFSPQNSGTFELLAGWNVVSATGSLNSGGPQGPDPFKYTSEVVFYNPVIEIKVGEVIIPLTTEAAVAAESLKFATGAQIKVKITQTTAHKTSPRFTARESPSNNSFFPVTDMPTGMVSEQSFVLRAPTNGAYLTFYIPTPSGGEIQLHSQVFTATGQIIQPDECDSCHKDHTQSCSKGVCTCKLGFAPPLCNDPIPVDPCNSCHRTNTQSCTKGVCTCKTGFEPPFCNDPTPVDPCTSCHQDNTQSCNDGVCTCKAGFEPPFCIEATPADPCDACDVSGTEKCEQGKCICKNNFRGPRCDIIPCQQCVADHLKSCDTSKSDQGTCVCLEGWTGDKCQVAACADCDISHLDRCDTSTSPAGICVCSPGWTGSTCSVSEDGPCAHCDDRHTKSCDESGPKPRCVCAEGWQGDLCDRAAEEEPGKGNGVQSLSLFGVLFATIVALLMWQF